MGRPEGGHEEGPRQQSSRGPSPPVRYDASQQTVCRQSIPDADLLNAPQR